MAIVDDDTSILDSMTLLIEAEGWAASVHASGEDFLANHHRAGKIDCLILDPHLDGITGAEVARALIGSQIPIIVLTARPESPITRRISMLGSFTILTKPVKPHILIEHINNAISR